MKSKVTEDKESDGCLWAGALIYLFVLTGVWWLCWRTNCSSRIYVVSIFTVAAGMLGALLGFASLRLWWSEHKSGKWGVPLITALFASVCWSEVKQKWPEVAWGSPRLASINGSVAIFENGATLPMPPMMEVTSAGEKQFQSLIGQRLSRSALEATAWTVLGAGHAKCGAGASEWLKAAEKNARDFKYGLWGGGSVDQDMRLLEDLRERLGDDTIRETVGPEPE
jgi:hypothetical protein